MNALPHASLLNPPFASTKCLGDLKRYSQFLGVFRNPPISRVAVLLESVK